MAQYFEKIGEMPGGLLFPAGHPSPIGWLARHAFSNIGGADQARDLWSIEYLARFADGLIKSQLRYMRDNAFSFTRVDGAMDVFVIAPHENRDTLLSAMAGEGESFRPSTDSEFTSAYTPSAEILYKSLVGTFSGAKQAYEAITPHLEPSLLPFDLREFFYCFALRELDNCYQSCSMGAWTDLAINHYAQASAACAIGGGSFNWVMAVNNIPTLAARKASEGRWSKLDPVREFAFKRRSEMPNMSRSAAIDRMIPEVLARAKAAGVPLTGSTPKETITGWFRSAKIK